MLLPRLCSRSLSPEEDTFWLQEGGGHGYTWFLDRAMVGDAEMGSITHPGCCEPQVVPVPSVLWLECPVTPGCLSPTSLVGTQLRDSLSYTISLYIKHELWVFSNIQKIEGNSIVNTCVLIIQFNNYQYLANFFTCFGPFPSPLVFVFVLAEIF